MARSFQSEDPAERILEDVEKAVFELANQRFRSGFAKIDSIIGEVYKHIEEVSNRKATVTGVETGFAELDRMTAGLQPADLVIIAARPSLGKTALSLNVAQHAAQKKGLSVGIFSLEMSSSQLVKRLLCAEAEIDSHKVNTGS